VPRRLAVASAAAARIISVRVAATTAHTLEQIAKRARQRVAATIVPPVVVPLKTVAMWSKTVAMWYSVLITMSMFASAAYAVPHYTMKFYDFSFSFLNYIHEIETLVGTH